jgi:putative hydrolase of the HAD superfamily
VTIKAVLFDLDGTLWDSSAPQFTSATELQVAAVTPLLDGLLARAPAELVTHFWESYGEVRKRVWDEPELREIDTHAHIAQWLSSIGLVAADDLVRSLWDALSCVPFREFRIQPFPETCAVLSALAARGFRMAAVTNRTDSAGVLAREFREFGFPDVFSAIITSGDVGYRKPHPAPFQAALAAVEASPREAVFVGDHLEQDMAGAAALEMTTVLRRGIVTADHDGAGVHHLIDSLQELLEILPGGTR